VSSVDGSQFSQSSGGTVSEENRRLVGAVGATLSVFVGVVTDSTSLSTVFPK
jgi:hypothetical protein